MSKTFFEIAKEFVALEKKHGVRTVFDPCSLADALGLTKLHDNDCFGCPLYSEDGCDLSLIGIDDGLMLPDEESV